MIRARVNDSYPGLVESMVWQYPISGWVLPAALS